MIDEEPAGGVTGDNRSLFDTNTSQKLSAEEIETLKREKTGQELVDLLVANSSTFEKKTQFSQDKFLRKKKQKYVLSFTVVPAIPLHVCDTYFAKNARDSLYLRSDTLAQLLGHANIRAGADVLIVDSCAGIVTAAAAERLAGHGHILVGYDAAGGRSRVFDGLRRCDLLPAAVAAVHYFSLNRVNALCKSREQRSISQLSSETQPAAAAVVASTAAVTQMETGAVAMDTDAPAAAAAAPDIVSSPELKSSAAVAPATNMDTASANASAPANNGSASSTSGSLSQAAASALAEQLLLTGDGPQCMILASRFSPIHMLTALLPLIAPGATFAVYCPSPEPLAQALDRLRGLGHAVNLQLTENFYREHQVLPNRTHPVVRMSGSGGYILSGIKVLTAAATSTGAAAGAQSTTAVSAPAPATASIDDEQAAKRVRTEP